jgi:HSP20 family protein
MKIVRYHQPAAALAPLYSFAGRNPVVAFEREFDRLFNNAFGEMLTYGPELAANRAGGFAVDLYEDKDNTYVRAELPGVDRKDINVEMVVDTDYPARGKLRCDGRRRVRGVLRSISSGVVQAT